MKRRLFVAINLPPDIKEKVKKIVDKIQPLFSNDIRFLPPDNWHLTISFLGYQSNESMDAILSSIRETSEGFRGLSIEFDDIILAPPQRPARMIWFCGNKKTSAYLTKVKIKLEDSLESKGVKFRRENRDYNAHLTLARFEQGLFRQTNLPNLEEPITFTAKSLDLMESKLKRSGAQYSVLAGFEFRKAE